MNRGTYVERTAITLAEWVARSLADRGQVTAEGNHVGQLPPHTRPARPPGIRGDQVVGHNPLLRWIGTTPTSSTTVASTGTAAR
jgi:hypothetical protein